MNGGSPVQDRGLIEWRVDFSDLDLRVEVKCYVQKSVMARSTVLAEHSHVYQSKGCRLVVTASVRLQ